MLRAYRRFLLNTTLPLAHAAAFKDELTGWRPFKDELTGWRPFKSRP